MLTFLSWSLFVIVFVTAVIRAKQIEQEEGDD